MKKLFFVFSLLSITYSNCSILTGLIQKISFLNKEAKLKTIENKDLTTDEVLAPNKIATIKINDLIDDSLNILMALENAVKQQDIKSILLYINNNGGSPGLFNILCNTIEKLKSKKPIVALVEDSACSGGYLMICSCNYIITTETSNIGSIGVIYHLEKHNNTKLTGKVYSNYTADIEKFNLKAGKFKDFGQSGKKEYSKEELEYLQAGINKSYDIFCNLVAKHRKLSLEEKDVWAEGQVFSGQEALKLNLIDEVGGLYEAVEKSKELIKQYNPDMSISEEVEFVNFTPANNNATQNK